MFRQNLVVDENLIVAKFDFIVWKSDDALHKIYLIWNAALVFYLCFIVGLARIFENDNIAALNLALRQKRNWFAAGRENKFINQQIIAD